MQVQKDSFKDRLTDRFLDTKIAYFFGEALMRFMGGLELTQAAYKVDTDSEDSMKDYRKTREQIISYTKRRGCMCRMADWVVKRTIIETAEKKAKAEIAEFKTQLKSDNHKLGV